jgi:type VI secretion system protein ImpH
MSTSLRGRSIIQRLLDEPYRFQFFPAIRLVVQWLGEQGVPPGRTLSDHLRFDNSLSLSFPAGQIEALRAVGAGPVHTEAELMQALSEEHSLRFAVTPAFMGFLGANGALPLHYTERVAAYQTLHKDEAPRAFLDLFSHRTLGLFYEAWCKYRVEHAISDGNDGFLPLLLNVAGFQPGAEVNNSDGICDEAIALYAGALQNRPVSAAILARLLTSHFGVPVVIEESVGYWSVLELHEQCSPGGLNSILGDNTILGERSWRPDLMARLWIGPLNRDQYGYFFPNGAGAVALAKMLSLLADQTVTYEIKLILQAKDVHPIWLGGEPGMGARLGEDCFLVTVDSEDDRSDMTYNTTPMAPLPTL